MKYYSKEFRLYLTGLLTGYRKMIEQSLATSKDPNYHLFANDVFYGGVFTHAARSFLTPSARKTHYSAGSKLGAQRLYSTVPLLT